MSGNPLWGPHGPHGLSVFVWQTDLKDLEVWSMVFSTVYPRLTFGNFPSTERLTQNILCLSGYCAIMKSSVVPDWDLQPEMKESHSPW